MHRVRLLLLPACLVLSTCSAEPSAQDEPVDLGPHPAGADALVARGPSLLSPTNLRGRIPPVAGCRPPPRVCAAIVAPHPDLPRCHLPRAPGPPLAP